MSLRDCATRLGIAAFLVGCGGPAVAVVTPTLSLNGEQSNTAPRALNDARAALNAAQTLHLDIRLTNSKSVTNFAADVDLGGSSAHLVGAEAGGHFEAVVSGNTVYLNGDAVFYKAIGQESLGQLFAGQWVIPPPSASLVSGLTSLVKRTNFADCILGPRSGTLSSGGVVDSGGNPALAIVDAGDKPGTTPQVVDVSLVGTAYPVSVKQTGPRKQDKSGALPCAITPPGGSGAVVTLSGFNKHVVVATPSAPIDLGALGGTGPAPATPTP